MGAQLQLTASNPLSPRYAHSTFAALYKSDFARVSYVGFIKNLIARVRRRGRRERYPETAPVPEMITLGFAATKGPFQYDLRLGTGAEQSPAICITQQTGRCLAVFGSRCVVC